MVNRRPITASGRSGASRAEEGRPYRRQRRDLCRLAESRTLPWCFPRAERVPRALAAARLGKPKGRAKTAVHLFEAAARKGWNVVAMDLGGRKRAPAFKRSERLTFRTTH